MVSSVLVLYSGTSSFCDPTFLGCPKTAIFFLNHLDFREREGPAWFMRICWPDTSICMWIREGVRKKIAVTELEPSIGSCSVYWHCMFNKKGQQQEYTSSFSSNSVTAIFFLTPSPLSMHMEVSDQHMCMNHAGPSLSRKSRWFKTFRSTSGGHSKRGVTKTARPTL